jgi:hypothetical protein
MKRIPLTNSTLFALVDDEDYEQVSEFKWRLAKAKMVDGYAIHGHGGRDALMHNMLMRPPKGLEVDHRNGLGLDNQRHNMRYATRSQQCMNRHRGNKRKGTSKYKGVRWWKAGSRWQARIKVNQKEIHLGYFTQELDAALAYDKAALDLFGEFANTNGLLGVVRAEWVLAMEAVR